MELIVTGPTSIPWSKTVFSSTVFSFFLPGCANASLLLKRVSDYEKKIISPMIYRILQKILVAVQNS